MDIDYTRCISVGYIFDISWYIQEYPRRDHQGYEWWPSITDKWKGDSCEWYDIEIHSYIDKHLYEDECRDAECRVLSEWILHSSRYRISSVHDGEIRWKEEKRSKKSEFLNDDWEYEVSLYFRKIAKFLDRFPEPKSEKSSTPYREEPLFCLIDFTIVIPLLEKRMTLIEVVIDTSRDISKWTPSFSSWLSEEVYAHSTDHTGEEWYHEISDISSGYKIECREYRRYDQYRSKIRLKGEEKEYRSTDDKKWNKSLRKISDIRSAFFDKICEKKYESDLRKLDGLEWWKPWNIEPTTRSIVLNTNKKYEKESEHRAVENRLYMFLKYTIRYLRKDHEWEESDQDMGNILRKIEIVIGFSDESCGNHSWGDLKRRIYTHRADHDHAKYNQRYDDKYESRIDTFFLHKECRGCRVKLGTREVLIPSFFW